MRIDPRAPWLDAIGDAFLIAVYEEALRMDREDEDAMEFLAHAYTRAGRHREGLALDRRLVRRRPGDPVALYNLACSLALTGRRKGALDALEKAVLLGYAEAAHIVGDEDLASLRGEPRFRALVRSLGGDSPERGGA